MSTFSQDVINAFNKFSQSFVNNCTTDKDKNQAMTIIQPLLLQLGSDLSLSVEQGGDVQRQFEELQEEVRSNPCYFDPASNEYMKIYQDTFKKYIREAGKTQQPPVEAITNAIKINKQSGEKSHAQLHNGAMKDLALRQILAIAQQDNEKLKHAAIERQAERNEFNRQQLCQKAHHEDQAKRTEMAILRLQAEQRLYKNAAAVYGTNFQSTAQMEVEQEQKQ